MDGIQVLRSVFLLIAFTIAIASSVPGVQSQFFTYGARSFSSKEQKSGQEQRVKVRETTNRIQDGYFTSFLNYVSNIRVPHAWFFHFYALSLSLSVFWAFQIAFHGTAFSFIATNTASTKTTTMTIHQVLLVWTMMTIQAMRRLYESFKVTPVSSSTIWIAHWGVGLVFYTCMSVAVWIEGTSAIRSNQLPLWHLFTLAPSLRSFIAIPIFLGASGVQYDCHEYLSSLKKYSLPMHPVFQLLICPHYFTECMIYFALALAAAPAGRLLNGTISCALVFVIINLGITAKNSRQWYAAKFGQDKIKGRWNMIPYIW